MLAAFRQPTVSRVMTMSPEHIGLHRMVDRLDPDQVRAAGRRATAAAPQYRAPRRR
jgi:hypothetical protein